MTHPAIPLAHQLQQNPNQLHTTKNHIDNNALCAQIGGDLWYEDKGHTATPAIKICQQCPVKTPCLAYALTTRQRQGIWGAHTPHHRRPLTQQLRLTSPT